MFLLEHRGLFYFSSAHADFSVWALFFFCPSFDARCLSRCGILVR
nr:MAG TPA: hypothetical protein [Caudoviricetes sp.]DAV61213.1 MAG TPA: hypothetical protein [Caudoviricetes sp.]